jgi:hypothetical protein
MRNGEAYASKLTRPDRETVLAVAEDAELDFLQLELRSWDLQQPATEEIPR